MKKTLLLSAALLAAGCAWAQSDVTPKNYHFNTADQIPLVSNHWFVSSPNQNGGNIKVDDPELGVWGTMANNGVDADKEFAEKGGLIAVVSAGMAETNLNNFLAGVSFLDLGGTVGKVLCLNGPRSGLKDVLKKNFPEQADIWDQIPQYPGGVAGGTLNFFLDPTDVCTYGQGYYKFSMIMSVVRKTTSEDDYSYNQTNLINNIYQVNNQGNNASFINGKLSTTETGMVPAVKNITFAARDAGGSLKWDDNYDYYWDPNTSWAQIDYYFNITGDANGKDDSGHKTTPARIKIMFNGSDELGNNAVLIKDVTITRYDGKLDEATYNLSKEAPKALEFVADPSTSSVRPVFADAVEAAGFTINGNTVTFAAPAEVFNVVGQKVAQGETATLAKGVYVAKVGEKSHKFVIK